VEFVGNTMVFLLAGLLFGYRCIINQEHLYRSDILWGIGLYAALMLIRLGMLLLFWPILNMCGQKVSWQEIIVMAFSGLRGAVGLALAIQVDQMAGMVDEVPGGQQTGSRFMFHIGGIAMLTLMINATLVAPLLRRLGLTKDGEMEMAVVANLKDEINVKVNKSLKKQSDYQNIKDDVARLVPAVEAAKSGLSEESQLTDYKLPQNLNEQLRVARELFIRILQAEYWREIEEGQLPRTSRVARVMIQATDEMKMSADKELDEWIIIDRLMTNGTTVGHYLGRVFECSVCRWTGITEVFPSDSNAKSNRIFAALALIKCNEAAVAKFEESYASNTFSKGAKDGLKTESREQVDLAKQAVEKLSSEDVKKCKTRRGAGKVLKEQMNMVTEMYEDGLVAEKCMSHITHKLQYSYRKVANMDTTS
jgi:hypothetical protein